MATTDRVSASVFGMATMPAAGSISGNGNATLQASAPNQTQAAASASAPAVSWVGIALVLVGIRLAHEKWGSRSL